ncbi:hypothetical protein CR513_32655, partial [Mucuna pruriens]
MNSAAERQNQILKDMVSSMISYSSLLELLWGESLKTAIYILNKQLTKLLMKFRLAKSQASNTSIFGVVQLKHDLIGCMKENWDKKQLVVNDIGKEENIKNVVFEEESVNDIGQILMLITIQETTPIIGDNVQTIVSHIVPEQDYDEIFPQILIEQPQQPQKVSLRKSIKERRHAIPDDYIIFLQEHEDDIGLTKDDSINFYQAMQNSNSKKWIDSMKDEMKSMQDNDVYDLIELLEGVKSIGCKWIFKTKKDPKDNIERYNARLVAKGFTQKEDIGYKETFSSISSKDSFRTIMKLEVHFDLKLHRYIRWMLRIRF